MIEAEKLSKRYAVRRMTAADADAIFALCLGNTLFYEYCEAKPTMEQVMTDLTVTPPGKTHKDKYYVGFFDGDELAAVMDLIEGYPDGDRCFIGFFMMNADRQGNGAGSAIVGEVCGYLKSIGHSAVMLGFDKYNPQSAHFWKKNGFTVVREAERDGGTITVAEKSLMD